MWPHNKPLFPWWPQGPADDPWPHWAGPLLHGLWIFPVLVMGVKEVLGPDGNGKGTGRRVGSEICRLILGVTRQMVQEEPVLVGARPCLSPPMSAPSPGSHFCILGGSVPPGHQGTVVAPDGLALLLRVSAGNPCIPLPGTRTGFSCFG